MLMGMDKKAKNTCWYIVLIGCLFAVGFWPLEAGLHVWLFQHGDFWAELWPHDVNELWMRFLISGLFLLASLIIGLLVAYALRLKAQSFLTEQSLDHIFESLMVTDPENRIIHVNKAFEETTGYKASEVLGRTPQILRSGRQDSTFYRTLWRSLKEKGRWQGEIWNRRKSGELYPEWLSISTVSDVGSEVQYHIAIFTDITSKKATEERIRHYAYHDPLTGLANRRLLEDHLQQAMALAQRSQQFLALIFIDLDGFKLINDQYGHAWGDQYLQAVAGFLQQSIREVDLLARLGGDEFVILLPSFAQACQIEEAVWRLFTAIRQQVIEVQGERMPLAASIGVSIYPSDAKALAPLLAAADQAMYRAKKVAGPSLCYWHQSN